MQLPWKGSFICYASQAPSDCSNCLSFENDSFKHSLVCIGSVLFKCTKLPEFLHVNSNYLIDKHFPVLIFKLALAKCFWENWQLLCWQHHLMSSCEWEKGKRSPLFVWTMKSVHSWPIILLFQYYDASYYPSLKLGILISRFY